MKGYLFCGARLLLLVFLVLYVCLMGVYFMVAAGFDRYCDWLEANLSEEI